MSEIHLGQSLDAVGATHTDGAAGDVSGYEVKPYRRGRYVSDSIKHGLDFCISLVGLIVLFPLIVMISGILLVAQGRPILIGHNRIGKNGEIFPCLKFRTMVRNADAVLAEYLEANPHERAEWNATRKLKKDVRITPIGHMMRRSSFDEVPQLFNILCGQMSVVGPRPIVESEAELYGSHIVDYMSVRPGLTGLWQISGRNDISYSSRVLLDVQYVAQRSTAGDINIMLKTIPAVLHARGSY